MTTTDPSSIVDRMVCPQGDRCQWPTGPMPKLSDPTTLSHELTTNTLHHDIRPHGALPQAGHLSDHVPNFSLH